MDQLRTVLTRTAQRGLIDLSQVAASCVRKKQHSWLQFDSHGCGDSESMVPWLDEECAEEEVSPNCGRIWGYVYTVEVISRFGKGWEVFSIHKTRDEAEKAREAMLAAAQAQANGAQTCRACGRPVSCPCGVGIGT